MQQSHIYRFIRASSQGTFNIVQFVIGCKTGKYIKWKGQKRNTKRLGTASHVGAIFASIYSSLFYIAYQCFVFLSVSHLCRVMRTDKILLRTYRRHCLINIDISEDDPRNIAPHWRHKGDRSTSPSQRDEKYYIPSHISISHRFFFIFLLLSLRFLLL